jgi:extracellular factor (EF) 3-hydroxypalmitic acid methyl ester biosynthesis protein
MIDQYCDNDSAAIHTSVDAARIHDATDAIAAFLLELQRELDDHCGPVARLHGDPWKADAVTPAVLARATAFLDKSYADIARWDLRLSDDDKATCRAYHRLRVQPYFLGCPFVRWSVDKPMGYPGDYRIVEMLFDAAADGASPLARVLSAYTLQVGPARAHRDRAPWVHETLKPLLAQAHRPLEVLSFACGPERVLRSFVQNGGTCRISLVDFDARALAHATTKLHEAARAASTTVSVRSAELSALHLFRDPAAMRTMTRLSDRDGEFDVVLVLGLLDYLPDRAAGRFLDLIVQALADDGQVLLTNLHVENPWRAFMEYVGHWEVIHRSKEAFERLCAGNGRLRCVEHRTDASGTNLFFRGVHA